jgi:protoporphyrinogen oxidase
MTSQHWAVVGAGVLGLELARRLRNEGHAVTVLEAAPEVGGLAATWKIGGITWDKHYHVILLSDLYTQKLLTDLGLQDKFVGVETKTGFYTDGQLYSMSNTVEFLKFPPLSLISKLRLGGTIFLASRIKNWKKLEPIRVADWLERWSGKTTTDKIWRPLLRSKLGESYRETSAAFIWATIARMYAARRSGLKKEMFGYVRGGYAVVLREFANSLMKRGVNIYTKAPVKQIRATSYGVELTMKDGQTAPYDRVVVTLPTQVISNLVPALSDDEHKQLNAVKYQGIVCASVLLKRPLDKFYVTNITDEGIPFTAVIEMSALVDKAEFAGHSLVYLPKYVDPSDPIFTETDDSIRARFVAALQKMYSHFTPDDVLEFQVSRVKNVFAISTLNYSETVPAFTTSMPDVFIVNSAQIANGTLNVNETLALAERAMPELLKPCENSNAWGSKQQLAASSARV